MKRKTVIVSLIMIFLAISSFSQTLEEAQRIFDQGIQSGKDLSYDKARKSFEQVIQACNLLGDPGKELGQKAGQELAGTYFRQGKQLAIEKDYNAAISNFEKSAQFADQYGITTTADSSRLFLAGMYYILGNNDLKNESYNDAIQNYNKALKYNPGYYKAYYGLGLVYMNQGNLLFMKTSFDKVISTTGADAKTVTNSRDAATSAFQKAGALALQSGNYVSAIDNLNNSLQYNNTEPRTYLYLAIAYNALVKLDDAIAASNKALQLQAGDKSDIYYEMGKAYEMKGNAGAACTYYKKVTTGPNVTAAKYQVEQVLKCK
jgi:tetratricopeptide (TPR) repeat protein